jgi:hypothetical protein
MLGFEMTILPIRTLVPALLAAGLLATSAAHAQEPAAADTAAARELGIQGVQLADAGKCDEAVEKLQRSEALFHAPTVLTRLGECQVQMGRLVEGTENLNKVSRETLAPTAPQAFVDAQERARKVLAEARPKIAKLKVAVAAPAGAQYAVTIDGTPLSIANLNVNRPVDPGAHTIEATGPGLKPVSAKVTLTAGGVDSIALTLEKDPNAKEPSKEPLASAAAGAEAKNYIPAIVAFAVGGAGLATGAIFGGLTFSQRSKLNDACTDKACPASAQTFIDNGKTYGAISTVGFVVGIAGTAIGAVLLIRESGKSETKTASLQLNPGLGGFSLSGKF